MRALAVGAATALLLLAAGCMDEQQTREYEAELERRDVVEAGESPYRIFEFTTEGGAHCVSVSNDGISCYPEVAR